MNKINPILMIHVSIIVCLFFFTNELNRSLHKPKLKISKQDSAYEFGTNVIKYISIGNERLVSSIIWIKTLLESDEEHFKQDKGNSWMYYRFNTISILDPMFYENYLFGGKYLSIIKDDIYGASIIYEKGLTKYQSDYELIKDTAFNYYFEIKDYDRAIDLYKRIVNHPRIEKEFSILPSILAKAVSTRGNPEEAFLILLNQYKATKIETIKKRLEKRLYSLKAQIDLECLNNGKSNCSQYDFYRNPYIKDISGKYRAKLEWKRFEIKKGRR